MAVDSSKASLVDALTNQRDHVLGILDGLSDDALRRPMLPSQWTCLGLVQHLAVDVERFWFRDVMAGDPFAVDESLDNAWSVPDDVSAESIFALYRREIELANAVIAATSPDQPPANWPVERWSTWQFRDLQEMMLHVIAETAVHAGHLDAVRELIDGRQWQVIG